MAGLLSGADDDFTIRMDDIMIDCPDAHMLAEFYAGLLNWEKTVLGEDSVSVRGKGQSVRLIFQREADYVPPVWPEARGKQQKMMHLDFTVSDLYAAVRRARELGAMEAMEQYNPLQWITMLDPAGHPFCLCLPE